MNVVDRKFLEELKCQKIQCDSSVKKKDIYAYGSSQPLTVAGSSTTNVLFRDKVVTCFKGTGKLKDFQLGIPIDESVKPIIQPVRRVPFHLRDKLGKKLDELEKSDIIEKVNEPSQWVSPVVVVPRGQESDIRLCVDMRQANKAIIRERFPIPTVDEVLQDLNESKVFSRIDIKIGYHQIELKS